MHGNIARLLIYRFSFLYIEWGRIGGRCLQTHSAPNGRRVAHSPIPRPTRRCEARFPLGHHGRPFWEALRLVVKQEICQAGMNSSICGQEGKPGHVLPGPGDRIGPGVVLARDVCDTDSPPVVGKPLSHVADPMAERRLV